MAGQTVQLWDYWFILRKRKLMILATLLVIILIVFLVNTLQRPIYSASADLIVELNQPTKMLTQNTAANPANLLDNIFFDTQAKLMQSSYFANLVAEELANHRSELPENLRNITKEKLASLARAVIDIPATGSARVIRITVENLDPRLSAYLANTIARVYIRYTQISQIDTSKQTLIFLMQKIEELRDKLRNSQYNITGMDIGSQLDAALKVYGENHPIVKELKAKKEEIDRKKSDAGPDLTPGLSPDTPLADKTPDIMQDEFTLNRSAKINEELYQVLLKKLQELDVTRDISAFNIRVIEPAKVPARPVRPNKRLNTIIGLIMGMVMGVGLAFFREYLDTTVKTVEELKSDFNLTVLGLIPSIEQVDKPQRPKNSFKLFYERFLSNKSKNKAVTIDKNEVKDELAFHVHRLASAEQLKAPIAEAYRTLRTNLQFTQLDRPLKTVLITSSIRGEGKTTTSVNLGIILAQTGKKILIVDTDLRRPRIHRAFNTSRDVGLTNLLLGETTFEDVVISSDVKNLDILPSGPLPPNPAELIATERMKNLIKYMESKYDIVLFDSPPLVAVTDAALLSADVDGLIMVVESGALPRDLLRQGLERLSNVKANILGAILNNVNLRKGSYYYYYYRYYHYDYAHADKT